MEPLDKEALRNILTQPKNALIKQYTKLFAMDGVKLSFEPEALDYIVDKSLEYKLGARGLRALCESIMMDVMFTVPSSNAKQYTITLDFCKEQINKADMLKLSSEQVGA